MKIALISYECPPDTAFGGIGTYIWQVSQLLARRGHHVEVFAGSLERTVQEQIQDVTIHWVQVAHRDQFPQAIKPIFLARHQAIEFDVMESPEIGADARHIAECQLELPLVVKLHTPSFMVSDLNHIKPSMYLKLRRFFGALRRFQTPTSFARRRYDAVSDPECQLALNADEITTPSVALGEYLVEQWRLDPNKVFSLPNPYMPSQTLLDIPVETQTQTITFIGRLERRKGVVQLAEAIPLILESFPQAKFRFIGSDHPFSSLQPSCKAYLQSILADDLDAVEFTGKVSLHEIPQYLEQTDICVFPSLWENFPNVCLEAMAAGRGVVGSSAGGMAEMLDNGRVGMLVPPDNSDAIANAIMALLSSPEQRMEFGRKARARIISEYSLEGLGQHLERSYQRAIRRRQQIGPRYSSTQKVYVRT